MTYHTDLPNNSTANPVSARDAGAQLMASAGAMAAAARAGHFAVNETGGQALLSAIEEMRTWYRENIYQLRFLNRSGEYGTSHGAQVVEPFMNRVAEDEQGLTTVLQALDETLHDAERAIRQAMRNYHQTDADNADAARKLASGLDH